MNPLERKLPRPRRSNVTVGAIVTGGAGAVTTILLLLQTLAATRQSFVQASGGRDQLAVALAATRDTLDWTRDSLRTVRRLERQCRNKSRDGRAAPEQVAPSGPPEPVRRGVVPAVLGNLASGVGTAVRWLFGG